MGLLTVTVLDIQALGTRRNQYAVCTSSRHLFPFKYAMVDDEWPKQNYGLRQGSDQLSVSRAASSGERHDASLATGPNAVRMQSCNSMATS